MDNIILYLLTIIQEQYKQICWLVLFICRYIPLKQWAHDELHSPKYQKFLTDKLPVIKPFIKQDWQLWNEYYRLRYGKAVKPVKTQKGKTRNVTADTICPLCGAPHEFIYDNSGGRGQFKCKICGQNSPAKPSVLSQTATVPILWLPNSSSLRRTGRSSLPRSSGLPMTMKSLKNSDLSNNLSNA